MRRSLVCFVMAVAGCFSFSAVASDPVPPPPLAPGEYLLVRSESDNNITPLLVSIRKDAAGALSISSAAAPLSPPAIFQRGELYQFTLFTLTSRNPDSGGQGDRFEGFLFVGNIKRFEGETFYRGTFAAVETDTIGSASAGTRKGEFVLYPQPAKP